MFKLKNKFFSGFSLIELIIVIGVIAILLAVIAPSFSGMLRDRKIESANKNAQLIFMSLQNCLSEYDYKDEKLTNAAYVVSSYETGAAAEKFKDSSDNDLSFTVNLSDSLSDEIRQGSWIAKIDPGTYHVIYVAWTPESKTFNYSDISSDSVHFNKIDAQDSYIKSNGYILGCYPIDVLS